MADTKTNKPKAAEKTAEKTAEKKSPIAIYEGLAKPPKEALRDITEGPLKGKTDINPQWRYKAMTEEFGLVGIGWKYEIQNLWHEPGANNEVLCFAQVAVYIKDKETLAWSEPIIGIGGSKLINSFSKGLKSNDEGYKMAVTDAFSTSLKMLGVAADIYAGKWDGSKYIETEEEPASQTSHAPQTQKPGPGPKLAGGPDTEAEHRRICEILKTTYPDKTRVFTPNDAANAERARSTKTAKEVIKELEIEEQKRQEEYWAAQKKIHDEVRARREAANAQNEKTIDPETPVEELPDYYTEPPVLNKQEEKGADQAFDIF